MPKSAGRVVRKADSTAYLSCSNSSSSGLRECVPTKLYEMQSEMALLPDLVYVVPVRPLVGLKVTIPMDTSLSIA